MILHIYRNLQRAISRQACTSCGYRPMCIYQEMQHGSCICLIIPELYDNAASASLSRCIAFTRFSSELA